jgi:hypothetical protein
MRESHLSRCSRACTGCADLCVCHRTWQPLAEVPYIRTFRSNQFINGLPSQNLFKKQQSFRKQPIYKNTPTHKDRRKASYL